MTTKTRRRKLGDTCSLDDCTNRPVAWVGDQLMCGKHYQRNQKHGDPHISLRPKDLLVEEVARRQLINNYVQDAKRRDLFWELSDVECKTLFESTCFYCGCLPKQTKTVTRVSKTYQYLHNGIDRVDNELGYMQNNVVTCCKICNWMKGTMSKHEFLEKVKNICLNQEVSE